MNQTQSLVSIIIPTYNSSHTIIRTIESIFKQTFKRFEVIVVDDGSTDDTKEVLSSLIRDQKIIYIYQKNQGCGVARNNGVLIAQGQFVCFLDADDYWHAEKLERQLEVFQNHPDCLMCYTESYMVDPYSDLVWETMHSNLGKPRSGNILGYLIFHNMITLSSGMMRLATFKHVGGFTPIYDLMMVADYDLWLKLAPLGKFYAILTPLMFYQTRVAAARSTVMDNHKQIARVFLLRVTEAPIHMKPLYMIGWGIHAVKYSIYWLIERAACS